MNLLNKNLFFIEIESDSRDSVLKFICDSAENNNIIKKKSSNKVLQSFIDRENQTSTGFEDGFAIPHAVSDSIINPAIIFVRLTNGVDWNSLDSQPTQYIIALFIPKAQRSESHMNVLSTIAVALLNEDFKNVIKYSGEIDQIFQAFENQLTENSNSAQVINSDNGHYSLLAITACSVGIAHTYLAAEKIEQACKDLNIPAKVSTQGSVGIKNDFTREEIRNADVILISSDVSIDLERFKGKRIYQTSIKPAISDPIKLVNEAVENARIIENIEITSETNEEKKSYVVKHLLSGVSYMIPFIIFGGLLIALALGIGKAIYTDGNIPNNTFLFYILKFGETAFGLMIAILGGFIANSIAGRSAIAPAMIVSLIANNTSLIYPLPGIDAPNAPLGFIGAILFGIVIGYQVKWMNSWKIHKNLAAMMPIFIIPLGVTTFYALLAVFVIGAPLSFVMDKFGQAMSLVFENNEASNIGVRIGIGIGMGMLLGAMIGFDMGGPINKIAFVMSSALLTQNINNPMGMIAAAIPVAPIGMGISTIVYKNYFSKEEKGLGISAIMMGSIGISEGAIPFAVKDPKRVFIANIAGSAVAGGIAGALGVTGSVAHGGPIVALLGAISGNFIGDNVGAQTGFGIAFFFLAIIIGVMVTVFVYGLLMKYIKDDKVKVEKNANAFTNFYSKLKTSIKSSVIVTSFNSSNRKIVSFSIMSSLMAVMLILGLTMLSISLANGELTDFINAMNSNPLPNPLPTFPILSIYGLFCSTIGFLLVLSTIFYSFTVFPKKEKPAY
ncbi:MAG: PTS fructose transporter subunit IIABC [Metamycoplasmataceae bacterium]